MFSGCDKYSGAIAGERQEPGADGMDVTEALARASVDETVVLPVPDEATGELHEVLIGARLDVENGGVRWEQEGDRSSAYSSVVSMSQMGSMLRDEPRNRKYRDAIRHAVAQFRKEHSRAPLVLDIGCGTGLLSLFAAEAGAAAVYACELFPRMAEIAAVVTAATVDAPEATNLFGEAMCQIHVIAKRSDALVVGAGPGADLPSRADLLVTEIFDSALLGEAVIPSVRDAWQRLLTPSAMVVPQAARVYACGVESAFAQRCRGSAGAASGVVAGVDLSRPDTRSQPCQAGAAPLPLHVDSLRPLPKALTAAAVVSEVGLASAWEWSPTEASADLPAGAKVCIRGLEKDVEASTVTVLPAVQPGRADAILWWWSLQLWPGIEYSTVPRAPTLRAAAPAGAAGPESQWQDHWVQVLQPLGSPFALPPGGTLRLQCTRTDTQLWFDALPGQIAEQPAPPDQKRPRQEERATGEAAACAGAGATGAAAAGGHAGPRLRTCPAGCRCGLHFFCSADRLRALTDTHRLLQLQRALSTARAAASDALLDVADDSIATLLATGDHADGGAPVVSLEASLLRKVHWSKVLGSAAADTALVAMAAVDNVLALRPGDDWPAALAGSPDCNLHSETVGGLIGDVHTAAMAARPLWSALNLLHMRQALRRRGLLAAAAVAVPAAIVVWAAPITLPQLRHSHGEVGRVLGFDHADFDAAQGDWRSLTYTYPLFMYEHRLAGPAQPVALIDLQSPGKSRASGAAGADVAALGPRADTGDVAAAAALLCAQASLALSQPGRVDAVMLWTDLVLDSAAMPAARAEGTSALDRVAAAWAAGLHTSRRAGDWGVDGVSAAALPGVLSGAPWVEVGDGQWEASAGRQELRFAGDVATDCAELKLDMRPDLLGGRGWQIAVTEGARGVQA